MSAEGFKEVGQADFRKFLTNYNGTLEHHCTTIVDPPCHGYYDFTKAVSPLGSEKAMFEARQAYCIYGNDMNHFHVRDTPTSKGDSGAKD